MADAGNQFWDAHLQRLGRIHRGSGAAPTTAVRRPSGLDPDLRSAEWAARPLSRLGRQLLADIEPYLEFYAIARAD